MRSILIACALLASAAPAFAQAGGGFALMIAAQDANRDGSITRPEAEASRRAQFARLDANSDGTLSAAERGAAPGGMEMMLNMADTNHDGSVNNAEFMGQPYRGFERFDADHNNTLSPTEIAAMRAAMGQ